MKYCYDCETEKENEEFYGNGRGGFERICKRCKLAHNAKLREEYRRRPPRDESLMKRCPRCGIEKPLAEFNTSRCNPDGHHSNCKSCAVFVVMRSFARHPDTRRRAVKRFYKSPAQAAKHTRRRALHANAPVKDFTASQWETMKALYGYCCVYCGRTTDKLTKDHIIPLSQGGSHTASNIVPACRSCNSKKQANAIPKPIQPVLTALVGD